MNNNSTIKPEFLSIFACFILDLPAQGSMQDCSTVNQSICVKCTIKSVGFNSGELITDTGGVGHNSHGMWLLISSMGKQEHITFLN